MSRVRESAPFLVRATERLEGARVLDPAVRLLAPAARKLIGSPGRRRVLQGHDLGHAIHPLLTDLPIGFWTSATVLDLVGGRDSRPAARRLVGLGLVSAGPTALTGWAEWAVVDGRPQRRVGVVHAVANITAVVAYAASWRARSRGDQARGRNLALAGATVASVGGYLGGHMTSARKVSSRHPAFE
ncbi:DUF2231 domain-containing protein [Aeromicrobium flavum]|uniref:DUF2231 domain-containing protein n=1 Tax=Aeromicrobium flavum TaxID=416568 RepID=UPI0031D84E5A